MASIKRKGDVVRVQLQPEERAVLAGLAREVAQLLGDGVAADADPLAAMVGLAGDDTPTPEDPAVHRLLPDGYDDPAGAAEFRRLTDAELRHGKSAALRVLAADAAEAERPLELAAERVDQWVQAINDIRLVLGVRLDITDESREWVDELRPEDPRQPLVAAYDWLSMLQELLLDALL